MYKRIYWVAGLLAAALLTSPAWGQFYTLTPDQMNHYTPQWTGERFPDGRPKAPDALLEKMKGLSAEEVNISRQGYQNQYAEGFQVLHPKKKLVGRAFTLQLMPSRPDISNVISLDWRAKGQTGAINHQTAIDMLQAGDVLVIDCFGAGVNVGGIIGDNLAYYIWKKTGAGFVIDGPIRDLDGVSEWDMAGYYKYTGPASIRGTMDMGINVPVRIGNTTVMPGDVVLGDSEGVYFIPPHLVKDTVDDAEITHLHDQWTRAKFDTGKYKSSDIYSSPRDPALRKEYEDFVKSKVGEKAYADYQARQQQSQGGRGGFGGPGGPGGPGGAPGGRGAGGGRGGAQQQTPGAPGRQQ
jgi:4-hydroxy-4-methyl-2-oxoglutarate aldolase